MTESTFITFEDFHFKTHGYSPYEWQKELAQIVDETKTFPEQISVPTGMGKTTSLDIAVWALAKDIHDNGIDKRRIPQRIFMTVDRRLVVDGAHSHATRIKNAIENNDELASVKNALSLLHTDSIDTPVLRVTSMHGGRKFSKDWLTPIGCQIVTSTVAQYASRLLFRGIGVSDGSLPINAGIVGVDSIVFMDEPHLTPVASMVAKECSEIQKSKDISVPCLQPVVLGATIPPAIGEKMGMENIFSPDLSHESSPEAIRRLSPHRPIQLVTTSRKIDKEMSSIVEKEIERCESIKAEECGDGILVSCNSISSAQSIASTIEKKYGRSGWRVQLITSRIRPYSRDKEHFFDGRTITVATQTIEVGVDINCITVVTEMASLPAIIQRIGRLNRNGKVNNSQGYIVAKTKYNVELGAEDFSPTVSDMLIYDADVLNSSWKVLVSSSDEDGVIETMPRIEDNPECWAEVPRSAPLSPYTKAMVFTKPRANFPWEFFVYGEKSHETREVEVAWRNDISSISKTPIMSPEKIVLPISEVKDFLKKTDDVDGCLPAVHFDDGEWKQVENYYDIRPDSIVVFDSKLGGYSDREGWVGEALRGEQVEDISHKVAISSGEGKFPVSLLFDGNDNDVLENGSLKDFVAAHPMMKDVNFTLVDGGKTVIVGAFKKSTVVNGDPVLLADHAEQTRRIADSFARASMWGGLRDKIALAAFHHDDGKDDRVFQGMLGNLNLSSPLAKSGTQCVQYAVVERGWRHEVLSADSSDDLVVRHLILSHHGQGRPMVKHGREVLDMSLEFDHCNDLFGFWGNALAEATLRVADWEASANPERVGRQWVKPEHKQVSAPCKSTQGMIINRITGVNKLSMSSMLASLGALITAVERGDEKAMIRFPHGDYPEVATSSEVHWDSSIWEDTFNNISSLLRGPGKGLTIKNAKWDYSSKDYEGFDDKANFFTYSADNFFDPKGKKMDTINLSYLFFPNSSSVFNAVVDVDPALADKSLFDFDSGASLETACWGGIDYLSGKANSGFETGALVNVGIRPWIVAGVFALGMPTSPHGAATDKNKRILALPRPDSWVTLEEYRNLVLFKDSLSWVWESNFQELSDKLKMWEFIDDETESMF